MVHPQGYEDDTHLNFVCRLHKALYGFKEVLRAWSNKIGQYLVTIGLHISNVDFSIYVKRIDKGIVLAIVNVNDILVRDSQGSLLDR